MGRHQTEEVERLRGPEVTDVPAFCLHHKNHLNETPAKSLALNMVTQVLQLGDERLPWITESVSILEGTNTELLKRVWEKLWFGTCYVKIRLLFLIVPAPVFSSLFHVRVLKWSHLPVCWCTTAVIKVASNVVLQVLRVWVRPVLLKRSVRGECSVSLPSLTWEEHSKGAFKVWIVTPSSTYLWNKQLMIGQRTSIIKESPFYKKFFFIFSFSWSNG